jgi:hypothetical protein
MTEIARLAAWTTPVTFAALVARVFSGEPDAPVLVLLAIVAPLVALVRTDDRLPASPVTGLLTLPGVTVVLWANVLVMVELARTLRIDRNGALVFVALVLLVPTVVRTATGGPSTGPLVALGVAGTAGGVVILSLTAGVTPWMAWTVAASRPALVFDERSRSTTEGRALAAPATLTFTEPHRVTAMVAASVKVFETDDGHVNVRDRRLADGESLSLQAGDRLAVDAGTRWRFEQGKRVPARVPSGIAWADPRERRGPRAAVSLVGVAMSMLGGALALVPPANRRGLREAIAAPALVLAFGVAGALWGVYAMYLAPDLLVGATLLTPLTELSSVVGGAGGPLVPAVVVTLLVLLVASGTALAARVTSVVESCVPPGPSRVAITLAAWIVACASSAAATVWPADAWRVLVAGFGLLTAAWVAPAIATTDRRATAAGGLAGVAAFGIVVALERFGGGGVTGGAPALLAAPAGWLVARIAARQTPAGG